MARPATFKPVKNGSKWDVSVPPSFSSTGKRKRLTFATRLEAEKYSQQQRTQLLTEGPRTLKFTDKQAVDANKAFSLLKEGRETLREAGGLSLVSAVRHYLSYLQANEASKPFKEVWEASLESRDAHTFSPEHLRDIKTLSRKFLVKFGDTIVVDITADQIEAFLRENFSSPTQFNKAHRIIHPAFSFAVTKGYISRDPFKAIRQRKVQKGDISVVSIEQAQKIAELCKGEFADCMPAVMIMMFAGVRPQEIQRLEWEAIKFDLDDPRIRISKEVAKGSLERARPRTIHIEPVLQEWLRLVPEKQHQGSIVPRNWRRKNMAWRAKAGIAGRKDILRHSFASYHLAYYNDENRTTASLGHGSSKMLFKHYDAAVERKPALKFWGLFPDGERNPAIVGVKGEGVLSA
jgi:integrase/recombinase XerD